MFRRADVIAQQHHWINNHFVIHSLGFTCVWSDSGSATTHAGWTLLTPQEGLALLEADGVRVTFLGGGGAVALRHGHHGGSVPHQELAQIAVIARGGAVQRRPASQKNQELDEKTRRPTDWDFHDKCFRAWFKNSRKKKKNSGQRINKIRQWNLPAVAVWCADVGSGANQEVHHVVMASTDAVVKGGDALVVGLAGVTHLRETFRTYCNNMVEFWGSWNFCQMTLHYFGLLDNSS